MTEEYQRPNLSISDRKYLSLIIYVSAIVSTISGRFFVSATVNFGRRKFLLTSEKTTATKKNWSQKYYQRPVTYYQRPVTSSEEYQRQCLQRPVCQRPKMAFSDRIYFQRPALLLSATGFPVADTPFCCSV